MNADGEEVEWTMDTLRELALELTVDADGNDATMEEFDPNNTVQWGYGVQFPELRGVATFFGPGNFVDDEGNAVDPGPLARRYTVVPGRHVDGRLFSERALRGQRGAGRR